LQNQTNQGGVQLVLPANLQLLFPDKLLSLMLRRAGGETGATMAIRTICGVTDVGVVFC